MIIEKRKIDDIDQFYGWSPAGWEYEYLQLSKGMLGLGYKSLELPGVKIEFNSYSQRILCRESNSTKDIVLSIPVESNEQTLFMGRSLEFNVGLVHQFGRTNEYLVFPGTRALSVYISEECAKALSWEISPEPLRRIPPADLQNFVLEIKGIWRAAESLEATEDETTDLILRDRALQAFGWAIKPWIEHEADVIYSPCRAFEIVEAATARMDSTEFDERPNMCSIAKSLGVSERVLYNSFRQCLRVGPYESYLLRRLHSFREELLTGPSFHGKVSKVAIALGFDHFGRLSESYRQHFGETPRQTMRRRLNP